MKGYICGRCQGRLHEERILHTEIEEGKAYLFEDIPARVCENCGEVWFTDEVLAYLDKAARHGVEPLGKIEVPFWSYDQLAQSKN